MCRESGAGYPGGTGTPSAADPGPTDIVMADTPGATRREEDPELPPRDLQQNLPRRNGVGCEKLAKLSPCARRHRHPPLRAARSCYQTAATKIKGPTAVSGNRASDLHLPGSGGRI
jgi:hypothetical protein